MKRVLTITLSSDWKGQLMAAAQRAQKGIDNKHYQGETLNFESPGVFFSQLTENRWNLLRLLQKSKAVGVRELARLAGRDVRRVHDDIVKLLELGLIEKSGEKLLCPYSDIHVDMHLKAA